MENLTEFSFLNEITKWIFDPFFIRDIISVVKFRQLQSLRLKNLYLKNENRNEFLENVQGTLTFLNLDTVSNLVAFRPKSLRSSFFVSEFEIADFEKRRRLDD